MEDGFGYGAIVRTMNPEEREETPADPGDEPRGACPWCGCPRTVRKGRDADGGRQLLRPHLPRPAPRAAAGATGPQAARAPIR